MKIPSFDDFKDAVALSTKTQATKRSGNSSSRLIWPLVSVCAFLIFVIGSSIYLVVLSRATSELANRAVQVERNLWVMQFTVRSAESGQRGYLLTSQVEYLDIYRDATEKIGPAIADVKAAIIDPAQQQAVTDLEPLIARKFTELAETIRLYGAGEREEALALVRTGLGRDLMEQIRVKAFQMHDTEQHILSLRSSNSSSTVGWLLVVNLVGLVFIIVLSVAFIFVMRRLAEKEAAHISDLERSNQELDDFAYIASHDLKEPLRGLFNHAAFLLEDYQDKLDEDGVRRLNRLGQLCQRMERLIDDLMYFSRLGRAELAVQQTDFNTVIVEIQQMMETSLVERHARIVVPHVLPRIVCDRARVTEVFRNLITNAVKYNDKSECLVEIGFLASVNTKAGDEKDVFYVRDNGVGIDPQFHQEIFRIFKRLQAPAAGQEAGSGVGLTFVKKIIERHGGRIWLESEPGRGTAFYFHLNGRRNEAVRSAHDNTIDSIPVHPAG